MKTTHRSRQRKIGLGALAAGLLLVVGGFSLSPAGAAPKQLIKVTICHRTNAPSNPYRVVTISVDASNGEIQGPDHTGHPGPVFDFSADPADLDYPYTNPRNGDQWGDIIPSYSWNGGSYPGLNWPEGEEIWNSDCGVPAEPAVGSITLDKVTAGDGQPVDTTQFTFSVVCDDATVPEAAPAIAPADPVATVATDVAQGTSCTIGETDAAGAASTTFSVDGAAGVAGPVTVTMTDAEQVIEVVATNTYACPAGQVPNGQGGCGVDACPTVDGFQADATLCPPVVENTVVTAAPAPPAPTQVAGVQVTQELPRTGKSTLPLAELGFGLVLLGAGALLFARDEAARA